MGAFKVELEERTIAHAGDLSKRWFGNTFDQLSKDQQYRVWDEAEKLARVSFKTVVRIAGRACSISQGSLPEYGIRR